MVDRRRLQNAGERWTRSPPPASAPTVRRNVVAEYGTRRRRHTRRHPSPPPPPVPRRPWTATTRRAAPASSSSADEDWSGIALVAHSVPSRHATYGESRSSALRAVSEHRITGTGSLHRCRRSAADGTWPTTGSCSGWAATHTITKNGETANDELAQPLPGVAATGRPRVGRPLAQVSVTSTTVRCDCFTSVRPSRPARGGDTVPRRRRCSTSGHADGLHQHLHHRSPRWSSCFCPRRAARFTTSRPFKSICFAVTTTGTQPATASAGNRLHRGGRQAVLGFAHDGSSCS